MLMYHPIAIDRNFYAVVSYSETSYRNLNDVVSYPVNLYRNLIEVVSYPNHRWYPGNCYVVHRDCIL